MPPFSKSPPELVARFDELAALVPDANRKQMFGYPTCVLGGHMFMGLHQEAMVMRLSAADREQFLREYDTQLFEPMPGRPMREYVVVPAGLIAGDEIGSWIARSYEYARSLPPKMRKSTTGRNTKESASAER